MLFSSRHQHLLILCLISLATFYCQLHAVVTSESSANFTVSFSWGVYLFAPWLVLLSCIHWIKPEFSNGLIPYSVGAIGALLLSLLIAELIYPASSRLEAVYQLLPLHSVIAIGLWLLSDLGKVKAENAEDEALLEVMTGTGVTTIKIKDIIQISSARNYLEVTTGSGSYLLRCTLKQFLTEYQDAGFKQVHRSHVVNPAHVDQIKSDGRGGKVVILNNQNCIKMGENFKALFPELLGQHT